MTKLYARQGDLIVHKLDVPISGHLERTKKLTFAGDSSGHPHHVSGDILFSRDGRTTLVRLSTTLSLEHGRAGGHESIQLEPGDYSIYPLRERGDATDRSVID